jgi:aspartate ammonia-lyase
VETLAPDRERCAALLDASYAFAAAYTEKLGYDAVSRVVTQLGGDTQGIKKTLEEMIRQAAD